MPLLWSNPVDLDHPSSFAGTAALVVLWSLLLGTIAGVLAGLFV